MSGVRLGYRHKRCNRMTELGLEKRCPTCGEWWPATRQFWYMRNTKSGPQPQGQCRACFNDYRRERRAMANG